MFPLRASLIALWLVSSSPALHAGIPGAIGVLGDSYSDEYQFYPPDRSTARNWVEILAATRGLDFGPFSLASRGTPRYQGFAYNWALTDACTGDLIARGQHTGLAGQVARGEVGLAMISIGGNDFIHAFRSPDPMAALERATPRAIENLRVAVETILRAHAEVKVVVATLSDLRNLPEIAAMVRGGQVAAATADSYAAAIARYNAQVKAIAASDRRVAVLDLDLAMRIANLLSRDHVIVGGRRYDRTRPSNRHESLFLADGRHLGTIGQGVIARMFIDTINHRFAAGIAPLSDREIVEFARSAPVAPAPGPADPLAGVEDRDGRTPTSPRRAAGD